MSNNGPGRKGGRKKNLFYPKVYKEKTNYFPVKKTFEKSSFTVCQAAARVSFSNPEKRFRPPLSLGELLLYRKNVCLFRERQMF
jgi:hypothetical protein